MDFFSLIKGSCGYRPRIRLQHFFMFKVMLHMELILYLLFEVFFVLFFFGGGGTGGDDAFYSLFSNKKCAQQG